MEVRAPNHRLHIVTDPEISRDMVKGILQTIFFHRLFPTIRPLTRNLPLLSLSLPAVDDVDLDSLLNDRANALLLQFERPFQQGRFERNTSNLSEVGEAMGVVTIRFFEKRRKRTATGGYTFFGRGYEEAEEKICWERWTINVTLVPLPAIGPTPVRAPVGQQRRVKGERVDPPEVQELRRKEATSLQDAAMRVIELAGEHKEHIPPITTTEENPFPYEIEVAIGG